MDVTALAFYAAVCALLSLAAPRLGTPLLRLGVGALVGIAAAALLPVLRAALAL
ncbi:hypothetical protein [Roseicyclus persicicus]|uniref:Uncharacterized protein n=1 Tax=Roseicyclus persicicus TaxID=2650661 RepID=A0A7X6GZH7_9RHOB|nr:hypothetical protein [Roseibacterium persicicum]NKX45245.1 hypothetical protein [Roseibacterium persicicum]